ncbi:MAG: trehalose-phosphatase [Leptolinea sp.]|nr:trehalose-phosphatase [Leptolinea sp.]
MKITIESLALQAASANKLRLFLDYDGTLADFAPSPDDVLPDKELIGLFDDLVSMQNLLPAIISGRRLSHIQKLLPVKGLLLGGTYGIELLLPDGKQMNAFPYEKLRPTVERLEPRWRSLISGKAGFYLEDKGWSLALHGLRAAKAEADIAFLSALTIVMEEIADPHFRVIQGYRFLEYAPVVANKSKAVRKVLDEFTPGDAMIIYIGDDDKDEEAMEVVIDSGGYGIKVSSKPEKSRAQFTIHDPSGVRFWLRRLYSASRSGADN